MISLTKEQILAFLETSKNPVNKRDLARAFKVTGDGRVVLKQLLGGLEAEGLIVKLPGQEYTVPRGLPTVGIIEITSIDMDGDTIAKPAEWNAELQGEAPRIEVQPDRKGHPALKEHDRALAKLTRLSDTLYQAEIIRRLDSPQGHVMGLVKRVKDGFVLQPANKRAKYDFDLSQADLNGATDGDLAVGEIQPARGLKRKKVRITEVIGRENDPKAISLIALHEAGIKPEFPHDVVAATESMTVPELKDREDLRQIPLVTIDGADARDFDDAVFAEPDGKGFHLIVAIADVAYYVRPDTALNKEAYRRGNSTYFPDRVVPMLPEKLSNDLCSLRPRENRACLAVHMWIDAAGEMQRHKFVRGLMRSEARLTYEQVQAAKDGLTDDTTGPLMKGVIEPLYAAYALLWKAREKRGALDLDLPERKIVVDQNNRMSGVVLRERLDSHKLIEEFMILANVAAAEALENRKSPCVYRVHDKPDPAKLDSAREFLQSFGLSLPKGQSIRPAQINQILHEAEKLPYSHLVSQVVLRAQSQAHYAPENVGHFGLALRRYAHFTSPIRRYADLLVHRSLIRSHAMGVGGLDEGEVVRLDEMSQHISDTERQSMEAERNAVDRFTAGWLSERIGAQFQGRITGATRFGLFVELKETGADGLIPISTLPKDFYVHDERQHALIGDRHGRVYRMGASVLVSIAEADPLTGSTIFSLVGDGSADLPGIELKRTLSQGRRPDRYKDRGRGDDRPQKKTHRKGRRKPGKSRP